VKDLQYIQCPHCEKKYAVSEKLCAAAGKKIRCKHCQQAFEIIISDDHVRGDQQDMPPPPDKENATIDAKKDHAAPAADQFVSPDETPEKEQQPDSDNKKSKETATPVKKKVNVQLLISIFLGLALLATATGAYLFFYHNELFHPSQKQDNKHIIPQQLIKPVSIPFPQQKHTMDSEKSKQSKQNPAQSAPRHQKPKSLLEGPDNPSQVCKDSAADYWFRTRLLTTSQLDTTSYLELLNMNLDQTAEIRRLCKDKPLIGRLTEAAKTGQVPTWIKTEIQSRNASMQAPKQPLQQN